MKYIIRQKVTIVGDKSISLGCNNYIGELATIVEFNNKYSPFYSLERDYVIQLDRDKECNRNSFYHLKENEFKAEEYQLLFDFMYED